MKFLHSRDQLCWRFSDPSPLILLFLISSNTNKIPWCCRAKKANYLSLQLLNLTSNQLEMLRIIFTSKISILWGHHMSGNTTVVFHVSILFQLRLLQRSETRCWQVGMSKEIWMSNCSEIAIGVLYFLVAANKVICCFKIPDQSV